MPKQLLGVRVDEQKVRDLDDIVDEEGYGSRAELIREMLDHRISHGLEQPEPDDSTEPNETEQPPRVSGDSSGGGVGGGGSGAAVNVPGTPFTV